jgi:hypothetical protein
VSRGTWVPNREKRPFRLQDDRLLWSLFPKCSAKTVLGNSLTPSCRDQAGSHDPAHTTHTSLACVRFRLCPVRSPLLRVSRLLSFPPGTEMVHFPGFASSPYEFRPGYPEFIGAGFPIRTSPDQSLFNDFPELIAAGHVLRRLPAPRHPPYALSSLTIKFCQSKTMLLFHVPLFNCQRSNL